MIVTVTLNAAIDKTLDVPNFQPGRRHRASGITVLPGGHGVNVARALKTIGYPVIATGFLGGQSGQNIAEMLSRENIPHDFVRIDGESRISTAIIDSASGIQTEINEFGPKIKAGEMEMLLEKLHYLTRTAEFVALCGSLPRGIKDGTYQELMGVLQKRGVKSVIDTAGEPLRLAIKGKPYIVKVNQDEAETVAGYEFQDEAGFQAGLERIREMGAENVVVTTADGFMALFDGRLLQGFSPEVDQVSTVGCGDAFLAGLLDGLSSGRDVEESFLMAMAASSANVRSYGACLFERKDYEAFLDRGTVTELHVC